MNNPTNTVYLQSKQVMQWSMELSSICIMSTNINRAHQKEPSRFLLSGLWVFYQSQDSSFKLPQHGDIGFLSRAFTNPTWLTRIPPAPAQQLRYGFMTIWGHKMRTRRKKTDPRNLVNQSLSEEGWHNFSPTYCQFINSIPAKSSSSSLPQPVNTVS